MCIKLMWWRQGIVQQIFYLYLFIFFLDEKLISKVKNRAEKQTADRTEFDIFKIVYTHICIRNYVFEKSYFLMKKKRRKFVVK